MDENKEFEQTISAQQRADELRENGKRYIRLFREAQAPIGNRLEELRENMAFYQGRQYQLSKYQEPKPWIVRMNTPYASMAIDTRVASMLAQDYVGILEPLRPEDTEKVDALQALMEDEWDRIGLDSMIHECIKNAAVVREAYLHFVFNGKKKYGNRQGVIECYPIEPASVLIDPDATKWCEAQYICITSRIAYHEAIYRYPELRGVLKKNQYSGMSPMDRGEIYDGNDYGNYNTESAFKTMITIYEKYDGVKIRKVVLIDDFCVEEVELSGLTRFPIAQLRWKKAAQSCYGISLMDDLIALQKAINAIESAITNTAVSYASPTLGVRKGSGLDPKLVAKTFGAPGTVYNITGEIDNAIKPIIAPRIDDNIVNIKKDYELTIDKISGVTNQYLGSIGTAGNTAEGAKMAIERARIVEGDILRNIKDFVEEATLILVEYITAKYAGEVIESRERDKSTGEVTFQKRELPEDIRDVQFSYYINLDVKSQYSKEREKTLLLELFQFERQYDSPVKVITVLDILDKYDVANKDEIVERYKRAMAQSQEQRAQMIIQLTEQAQAVGANPELLTMAISEIMDMKQETPYLDQLMIEIKNVVVAQQQQAEQLEAQHQMEADELVAQGMPVEAVTQAKEMLDSQLTNDAQPAIM